MPRILKYKNGQALVSGVEMTPEAMLMLDNGIPVDIEVTIDDGKKITDKQRRKIFALLNDIYVWSGNPQEDMRQMFIFYLEMMNGYENISLRDCSRRVAGELIDLIIEWVFIHDVPLNYKTSDMLKNDRTFLYMSTINRTCVICGTQNSDIAHRYTVGAGRNRNDIDHYGNEVLALCRFHHSEQHAIGIDSFNEKYHLDVWIKVDKRLNAMLKGRKYE